MADDEGSALRRRVELLEVENKMLRTRMLALEVQLAEKEAANKPEDADADPTEEEKQVLLEHLRDSTWTGLKPSTIAGVGVFALRPIPAGCDPFKCVNDRFNLKERFCVFTTSMLRETNVPEPIIEQVRSMFAPLTGEDDYTADRDANGDLKYGVLASGLHSLNLSWYLNHSETPNIGFQDAEIEGTFNSFVTKRRIEQDEELLVDYRELGEEYLKLVHGDHAHHHNTYAAKQLAAEVPNDDTRSGGYK